MQYNIILPQLPKIMWDSENLTLPGKRHLTLINANQLIERERRGWRLPTADEIRILEKVPRLRLPEEKEVRFSGSKINLLKPETCLRLPLDGWRSEVDDLTYLQGEEAHYWTRERFTYQHNLTFIINYKDDFKIDHFNTAYALSVRLVKDLN